jgi:hypothetical protein
MDGLFHVGFYKAVARDNTFQKNFINNERFKAFGEYAQLIREQGGNPYNPETWPVPERWKYGEYRSVFMSFHSYGNSYACNRKGLFGPITRLMQRRDDIIIEGVVVTHDDLVANQFRNVGVRKHRKYARRFRHMLGRRITERVNEMRIEHVNTGVKKKLKQRSLLQIINNNTWSHPTWIDRDDVEYKCKPQELLAESKALRGTADLTNPASIRCGYLIDKVKEVFEEDYVYKNCRFAFCKSPKAESLYKYFQRLVQPEYTMEYIFFSDDCCFSIKCGDEVIRCNGDVKSCDGSNYMPVFGLLRDCMSFGEHVSDVEAVFEQLFQNLYVRDPQHRKRRKVRFKNRGAALFSGSTLTTCVNNMANILIGMELADLVVSTVINRQNLEDIYRKAAARVGFQVKLEVCEHLEDLQFLKVSPTQLNGELQLFVNAGTWFKSWGTFAGDLPGRGPYLDRIRRFLSEVVVSRKGWGYSFVSRSFNKFILSNECNNFDMSRDIRELNRGYIPDLALMRRYRCNTAEVAEYLQYMSEFQPGYSMGCSFIRKVMEKDYGFSCATPHPAWHISAIT